MASSASPLISSKSTLSLTSRAAFGDIADIFTDESTASTYNVNLCRDFVPGEYKMHLVPAVSRDYKLAGVEFRVAILCLENLCPIKIHNLLQISNIGDDHRCSNYMSRYKWMNFKNFVTPNRRFVRNGRKFKTAVKNVFHDPTCVGVDEGVSSDDEDAYLIKHWFTMRNLVFFVDMKHFSEIEAGSVSIERENQWIHSLKTGSGESLGFIIDVKEGGGLVSGDWHYGCVLVDPASKKCFGFVFGDFYNCENLAVKRHPIVDIDSINYTIDMTRFLK